MAFQHILDAIADGVYVASGDRRIMYWSAGAERITGYTADEVLGRRCADELLVHTDPHGNRLCDDDCPLQSCSRTGHACFTSEAFLRHKSGQPLAVYAKTTTFRVDGQPLFVQIFGERAVPADREALTAAETAAVLVDPLTGLFNRRYLEAALEHSFAAFRRLGRRYGLLCLDIDDLTTINGVLGRHAGDEAIRFVAGILAANVRKMDVVVRSEGDDFAVICHVATPADLSAYGRRLTRLVREARFPDAENAGLRITVSAGGAFVDDDDSDERAALRRAATAVSKARRAGCLGFAAVSAAARK